MITNLGRDIGSIPMLRHKNVPRKCPLCKGPLQWSETWRQISCYYHPHFWAELSKTGIDFWLAHFILDDEELRISSESIDGSTCTELRDRNGDLVLLLREWHPYITGRFVKDITTLVKRLLKLKAFY